MFILGVLLFGCQSNQIEVKTSKSLTLDEVNGIEEYKKGNYKRALELLETPAKWGV